VLSKLLSDGGDNRHLGLGKCISKPVAISLGKSSINHKTPGTCD
jgi:hypothetical protein